MGDGDLLLTWRETRRKPPPHPAILSAGFRWDLSRCQGSQATTLPGVHLEYILGRWSAGPDSPDSLPFVRAALTPDDNFSLPALCFLLLAPDFHFILRCFLLLV